MTVRGAAAVARQTQRGLSSALRAAHLRPALVKRAAGVVVTMGGRPITVIGFTVADKTAEIDAVADPDRPKLAAAALNDE
jgi:hypothetical protein